MVTGQKSINKPIEETNTISKNIYTVLSSFVVVLAIAAARKNLLKLFQLIQPSCYYHRSTQDAKEVMINEAAKTITNRSIPRSKGFEGDAKSEVITNRSIPRSKSFEGDANEAITNRSIPKSKGFEGDANSKAIPNHSIPKSKVF